MIMVAPSPGRMVVTANVIIVIRNSVSAIESRRLKMYDMRTQSRLRLRAGALSSRRPRRLSPQPDFVELEVAAVRMNNRVEAPDRGLRANRPVAEPEDDVVILVEDA